MLVAGVLRASVPATEFTLEWKHSVQQTQWLESYRIERGMLVLVEARVEGSGAGMEPGANARFDGRGWVWQPAGAPLRSIDLAHSTFGGDYQLCSDARCSTLRDLTGGSDGVVTLRPCPG